MGFKMKEFSGYVKPPAKQLKPEYMRTEEEREFYTTGDNSTKYKPEPMGKYRTPSAVSTYVGEDEEFDWDTNTNPKRKGDTITLGVPEKRKTTFKTDVEDMVSPEVAESMKKTRRQTEEKKRKRNVPHRRDSFEF